MPSQPRAQLLHLQAQPEVLHQVGMHHVVEHGSRDAQLLLLLTSLLLHGSRVQVSSGTMATQKQLAIVRMSNQLLHAADRT